MLLQDLITAQLSHALAPTELAVIDESHLHFGHAGWREGGETHFRVRIVAAAFAGLSRVERHRRVNAALQPAFERGLHALAIEAKAPQES